MKNHKDLPPDHEKSLVIENEALKAKLSAQYGMEDMELDDMPPALQNEWLKNICAFEEQYQHAKRLTLYEFLGKPGFRKSEHLKPEEITQELDRIQKIMAENGVELHCLAQYDDERIYKFITEELFHHKTDGIRIPGMTTNFIYEEFYPNHDYDLRQSAERFVRSVLANPWSPDFSVIELSKKVTIAGKEYERSVVSAIITTFQEAHGLFDMQSFDIIDVAVNERSDTARVRAHILAWSQSQSNTHLEGDCLISYEYENDYWSVTSFAIPGLDGDTG